MRTFRLLFCAVLAITCHPAAPRESNDSIRDNTATTFYAVYVGFACGDDAPQLYRIRYPEEKSITDEMIDNPGDVAKRTVLLALPKDMLNPERSEYSVPGNIFELTGYAHTNSNQLDLTRWRLVPPYQKWLRSGAHDNLTTQTFTTAITIQSPATRAEEFVSLKYDSCF